MLNPLIRSPLILKTTYRLIKLQIPDYVGIYAGGERFNVYIEKNETVENDEEVLSGTIDDSSGILKFNGIQKQNKLEFKATYLKSCVRASQIPVSLDFSASKDGLYFQGVSQFRDIFAYSFNSGVGIIHHVDKPFVMGIPPLIDRIKEKSKKLPEADIYQTKEYCH